VLEQLSQRLGQPFVVENKAGAGSVTGTGAAARAEPDGYTLMMQSSTFSIVHSVQPKRPYDTFADFAAVAPFGVQPSLLVVSPSKGMKSAADLIAAAKAKPGTLNFASAGPGSASHLAAERFIRSAGIQATHVPFRNPSEGVTETLTGRIDFYFPPISVGLPLVRDGKLVPLAVSTKARAESLPDVPTSTELGLKDSAFEFWVGLFAPAKTPRDIVDKLNREVRAVLATPAIQERVKTFGYVTVDMSPEQYTAFLKADVEDLGRLITAAGITAGQ
jgi:tripartite-type tricarboxylate transporter receptor subunit TctC